MNISEWMRLVRCVDILYDDGCEIININEMLNEIVLDVRKTLSPILTSVNVTINIPSENYEK